MATINKLSNWFWSALILTMVSVSGCGQTTVAPENTAQMSSEQVALAFADDLINKSDEEAALRWVCPEAQSATSSQALFLAGVDRQALLKAGNCQDDKAEVNVSSLTVGQYNYVGSLVVHIDKERGQKISSTELHLRRSDGMIINI